MRTPTDYEGKDEWQDLFDTRNTFGMQ